MTRRVPRTAMKSTVPTYRQLAELAGVSLSTVSLAMRNDPSLPKGTRDRIQRLARSKGYKVNPVVASLMTQLRATRSRETSEKIAFLTFWPKRDQWMENENNRRFFEGAARRAEYLGYGTEVFWAKEPGLTQTRLSRILYARGIRAVLASHLMIPRGHVSLKWEHFVGASIGLSIVRPALHSVTHGFFGGMQTVLRQLRHRGYRRVGYVTLKSQDDRVNNLWLGGYLAYGYSLPAGSRVTPLLPEDLNTQVLETWLKQAGPDCVVTNEKRVLQMLNECGYSVPRDIGFAMLDLPSTMKDVAGMDQRPDELGAAAVDVVVRQLQNNEFGVPASPVNHVVAGVWRDGKTVRNRAGNRLEEAGRGNGVRLADTLQ